jgi:hypothetical protein
MILNAFLATMNKPHVKKNAQRDPASNSQLSTVLASTSARDHRGLTPS